MTSVPQLYGPDFSGSIGDRRTRGTDQFERIANLVV